MNLKQLLVVKAIIQCYSLSQEDFFNFISCKKYKIEVLHLCVLFKEWTWLCLLSGRRLKKCVLIQHKKYN